MKLHISIEGISPMILNRFTDEAQMSATNGTRSAMQGERLSPEEDAQSRLYTDPEAPDVPIMPAPNVLACITSAGKFHKAGKNKMTTQKSSLVPAAVTLLEPYFTIQSRGGWRVDARPVRIPATGGRIIRYRPLFNDWALDIVLEHDTEMFSVKLLREVMDSAGKKIGMGDFRPDCRGPFGRFVVTRWSADE